MIQLRRSLLLLALALVAVRVVYWLMNAELVSHTHIPYPPPDHITPALSLLSRSHRSVRTVVSSRASLSSPTRYLLLC